MKMLVAPTFTATTEATAQAQARLPVPAAAVVPLAEMRHIMAQYTRHYTGQPRVVCDPVHLETMIGRLEGVRGRVAGLPQATALAPHLILLSRHLTLLTFEAAQVRAAALGSSPADQASWLATRLDRLIDRYRVLCEGRERLSRRPGLLPQLLDSLDQLAREMASVDLPGGEARAADHAANRALVEALRRSFTAEAEAVAAERARATPDALSAALADEAQDGLDMWRLDFAATDRMRWDPLHLSRVCDRLGEVEQQLIPLAAMGGDPILAQAVTVVQRQLDVCEEIHAGLTRGNTAGEGAEAQEDDRS